MFFCCCNGNFHDFDCFFDEFQQIVVEHLVSISVTKRQLFYFRPGRHQFDSKPLSNAYVDDFVQIQNL